MIDSRLFTEFVRLGGLHKGVRCDKICKLKARGVGLDDSGKVMGISVFLMVSLNR